MWKFSVKLDIGCIDKSEVDKYIYINVRYKVICVFTGYLAAGRVGGENY